ncbi:hypothetical protein [Actibacterium sp. 188UL27-1]|uniref:hypothetical protein n=1 Tax=Actibacterium sp. 188UL27-1 TaxID=2786961 RepID=UPI0019587FE2|nr:hypothetical protein [Actibacterium sp. 188UL27-1]MBM7069524.1 hypothetical protein [Actibacterium sp. 188UL27-1]
MWRSLFAASLALALTGCLGDGSQANRGFGAAIFSRAAPTQVSVREGAVTVAGPAGYCVDTRSSRLNDSTAFVLLGSCAGLSGRAATPENRTLDALLTATVAPGGTAPVEAFERFFTTDAGRAALAQDGDPAKVDVFETEIQGDVFLMHLQDSGLSDLPDLAADRWRAVFTMNGAVVSATVIGLRGHNMGSERGMSLAMRFAQRIQQASGGVQTAAAQ